ncbi:MAG: sulfate ABC transporter substrate-binding protein [Anaerolineales bacterium]|nr:sulfate ABC transporter substrate-binding protein [Anaerolineales bacterium]
MKTKIEYQRFRLLIIGFLVIQLLAGCGPTTTDGNAPAADPGSSDTISLTLGAYTTPREAYQVLIPMFQQQWLEETGQTVVFEESYLGSGAQSRAIVEGFEADIAALSLEADINRIREAGLINHDWKDNAFQGMVTTSIVSFAVREGNPLGIQDWADLATPGVEILTPNPKTSGGAMWNVLALYGAAIRGFVQNTEADNPDAAANFLLSVLNNVTVMDKGARESITNFEKGIGDLAITYENEVLVGQRSGQTYELVIPTSTILIENPVAVIDTYVDKHGTREAAEAFVAFLFTTEAQRVFAQYGLRSIDPTVAEATADLYPPVEDLFTVEYFDGWESITPAFFGQEGIYTTTVARIERLNQ